MDFKGSAHCARWGEGGSWKTIFFSPLPRSWLPCSWIGLLARGPPETEQRTSSNLGRTLCQSLDQFNEKQISCFHEWILYEWRGGALYTMITEKSICMFFFSLLLYMWRTRNTSHWINTLFLVWSGRHFDFQYSRSFRAIFIPSFIFDG